MFTRQALNLPDTEWSDVQQALVKDILAAGHSMSQQGAASEAWGLMYQWHRKEYLGGAIPKSDRHFLESDGIASSSG